MFQMMKFGIQMKLSEKNNWVESLLILLYGSRVHRQWKNENKLKKNNNKAHTYEWEQFLFYNHTRDHTIIQQFWTVWIHCVCYPSTMTHITVKIYIWNNNVHKQNTKKINKLGIEWKINVPHIYGIWETRKKHMISQWTHWNSKWWFLVFYSSYWRWWWCCCSVVALNFPFDFFLFPDDFLCVPYFNFIIRFV